MSEQIPLFVEDELDAIRATVEALGSFKGVGHAIRPELRVDAAGRWLADCCSADKRERLSPGQLALLRRMAREKGVHILAAWEMRDAGYAPPVPVKTEDVRERLQREFVEAVATVRGLAEALGRVGLPMPGDKL